MKTKDGIAIATPYRKRFFMISNFGITFEGIPYVSLKKEFPYARINDFRLMDNKFQLVHNKERLVGLLWFRYDSTYYETLIQNRCPEFYVIKGIMRIGDPEFILLPVRELLHDYSKAWGPSLTPIRESFNYFTFIVSSEIFRNLRSWFTRPNGINSLGPAIMNPMIFYDHRESDEKDIASRLAIQFIPAIHDHGVQQETVRPIPKAIRATQ